jgi:cytochrome c-type protein NapC
LAALSSGISLVGALSLLCAALAALTLLDYLIKQPPLDVRVKVQLAFAFGVFPVLAAISSTAEGMKATTERPFCGSCHVMELHVADAEDPNSMSLAARHARNPFFGDRNCYVCHADYGMLGYAMTKLNGMRHVWSYYAHGFVNETAEQAIQRIKLYKPYDNANCMQCHSGTLPRWRKVGEHVALEPQLRNNSVSCASKGCHGQAHPFSKQKRDDLSALFDDYEGPRDYASHGNTEGHGDTQGYGYEGQGL